MSDDQNKQIALVPVADFTIKDLEAIQKFKDEGLIGLAGITDVDAQKMMSLYLDGKSYRQIANLLKKNKTIILYLSHKFNWFEMREQYLEELGATIKDNVVESKLRSQEFLLDLIHAYQKKVSKNIHDYLRTDNADFFDKIDSKDINTLLKVIELLDKVSTENRPPGDKPPLVGLNAVGEGMTITKTGKDSIEITPKSPFANKLKQFAEMKRQEERAAAIPTKSDDITIEQPPTVTKKENENE